MIKKLEIEFWKNKRGRLEGFKNRSRTRKKLQTAGTEIYPLVMSNAEFGTEMWLIKIWGLGFWTQILVSGFSFRKG